MCRKFVSLKHVQTAVFWPSTSEQIAKSDLACMQKKLNRWSLKLLLSDNVNEMKLNLLSRMLALFLGALLGTTVSLCVVYFA